MIKSLPLLWRMSLPTLGVSLLLLAVGLAASASLYRGSTQASEQLDKRITAVVTAQEFLLAVRDLRNELDRFARTQSAEALDAGRRASERARKLLEKLNQQDQEPQLLEAAALRVEADAAYLATADSATADQTSEALQAARKGSVPAAAALLDANEAALEEDSSENRRLARNVGMGLAFLAVCGSAAGLLAGLGVARSVVNSIQALGGSVRSISESLSEGPPAPQPAGELRELLNAMTAVQEKTEGIVTELQRSRATAARADQLAAVGQLAAGIAHELRNPLTAIKLLADSASESDAMLDPGEVAVIRTEATRMHEMLQTFLDFARPPRMVREPIDLVEVTRQTVDFVRPKADRVGVEVFFQPRAERAELVADPHQVRQVLLNLLINAVEAQPDGGAIDVTLTTPDADSVVIEVADTGTGIPPEMLARLFEPFVSGKETGVGLGLAVSQRIIASHGGALTGQNRPEGGATFRVVLPTTPPSESEESSQ